MSKTLFPLIAFLLFSCQQAFSHDVWLQPKEGSLMVIFGHGDTCDPYNPDFVKDAKGFDCKGAAVAVEMVKLKDRVSLSSKGNPATVTIFWDAGYGMVTTDGWKKITKREAAGKYTIIEALKLLRYSKALVTPCDAFSKPVGLVFEIIPEKDPFAVKPGETLPLRALLEGKPIGGAEIKTGDTSHSESKEKLLTDKDGKASIIIERPGFQIIHAEYKAPLKDDPDADVLRRSSSLSFMVK